MAIARPSFDRATSGSIDRRAAGLALFVCAAYYLGALVGFELKFGTNPISILWPPNSILLAGLLLAPTSYWWLILLAAFPAHLAAQLQGGVPTAMIVGWFVSNCSEALIGAWLIRRLVKGELRFESLRHTATFLICGALVAPFVSSFLDSALVVLVGWGEGAYWDLWTTRFFSNVLATLTIVPVIVCWAIRTPARDSRPLRSHLEAALLTAGLVVVSFVAFASHDPGDIGFPLVLYLPIPFLLWAAVRLGPRGTSTVFLAVVSLAIWGAIHGHGPFLSDSAPQSARSIQLFLSVVASALLVISAVIQERENAQAELRERREQLQLALSAGRIGTWEWDVQTDRGSWSEISKAIFGRESANSITLQTLTESVHPVDRPAVRAAFDDTIARGVPIEIEFRIVRPDESVRWVVGKGEALSDRQGRTTRLIGVNIDVTDLVEAQEIARRQDAIRRSERHFRQLADAMPHVVWGAAPDGTVDYRNRRWYEVIGDDDSSEGERCWLAVLHPEDRKRYADEWEDCVRTGRLFDVECRLLFPARGEYRWQLARGVPVRDEAGQIIRWYGSFTDIDEHKRSEDALRNAGAALEEMVEQRTEALQLANHALLEEIAERSRAEESLRISEERFSKAFASSPDAVVIVRRSDGRILEVNDRWQSMLGFDRASVLGRTLFEIGVSATAESEEALAHLRAQGIVRNLEVRLRTRAGKVVQTLISAEQLEMARERCMIAIIRDVTEQRKVEREAREQRSQLTHLTRVAVLGELTGAIAHELNQPLTAILSNAQATQRVLSRDGFDMREVLESLKDIVDQDKRAGEVIRRLRVLLKKGEAEHRPVDLNGLVADALQVANAGLVSRGITVSTSLGHRLPRVSGDSVQLEQVLLNLIVNASDEMAGLPSGDRRLTIATESPKTGEVLVSVTDCGRGIAADSAEKLFEPFFSTKESGLGLGLSISRSIITAHGGQLWAESRGKGAVFRFRLPTAGRSA